MLRVWLTVSTMDLSNGSGWLLRNPCVAVDPFDLQHYLPNKLRELVVSELTAVGLFRPKPRRCDKRSGSQPSALALAANYSRLHIRRRIALDIEQIVDGGATEAQNVIRRCHIIVILHGDLTGGIDQQFDRFTTRTFGDSSTYNGGMRIFEHRGLRLPRPHCSCSRPHPPSLSAQTNPQASSATASSTTPTPSRPRSTTPVRRVARSTCRQVDMSSTAIWTVPTGVALVREAGMRLHHGAWDKGSTLMITGGRGEETGQAAVTTRTEQLHSRIFTLLWPDQRAENIVPYPWGHPRPRHA